MQYSSSYANAIKLSQTNSICGHSVLCQLAHLASLVEANMHVSERHPLRLTRRSHLTTLNEGLLNTIAFPLQAAKKSI
jgi:hypothetical protein